MFFFLWNAVLSYTLAMSLCVIRSPNVRYYGIRWGTRKYFYVEKLNTIDHSKYQVSKTLLNLIEFILVFLYSWANISVFSFIILTIALVTFLLHFCGFFFLLCFTTTEWKDKIHWVKLRFNQNETKKEDPLTYCAYKKQTKNWNRIVHTVSAMWILSVSYRWHYSTFLKRSVCRNDNDNNRT